MYFSQHSILATGPVRAIARILEMKIKAVVIRQSPFERPVERSASPGTGARGTCNCVGN